MKRKLMRGNDAIIAGALLAGCRSFFGYPITPASEIAHAAAKWLPDAGGTFIQAESEIASINMVYGASSTGQRTMTASSSPGMSLKQEGLSYCAGSELPCVVTDVVRGGPGLGNIAPEQSDYNQMVKGGGHGNYKVIVLAPNSVQEMCDLTMLAFELADKYRNPAAILTDGFVGQMIEPLTMPEKVSPPPEKPWAVRGDAKTKKNLISSILLDPDELEPHITHLKSKYDEVEKNEIRFEEYRTEGAKMIAVGYGIVSRVLYSAVDAARERGLPVGLLRLITLWPFPTKKIQELAERIDAFFVVELSTGQMVDDVRLAVEGKRPVHLYTRYGGAVPTTEELLKKIQEKF
ncbi:MAG: 3-methyl-2-oxobutanoate dehydrogenase subunit VorB [Candidatus Eiseniibacteriota bacterium]|nr:MAG: 3-methyl-2-oxobutanoate dehydrogenase subunit VorB [Candidatus Eisenbacteria bacterium]